jgi:4'-phosphopantetheinyl transferase EntD
MAAPAHTIQNPAQLSSQLADLFPPGVVAAELLGNAPVALLTEPELQFISHCADKRIQDFTAGRACAHRALAELGVTDFSLLSSSDRAPIWPPSITGSITHTEGFRAAVVAYKRDLCSIGVDCESIAAVDRDLWSRICHPAERERLAQLDDSQSQRLAALIFATKEAFYKCQYPLTKQWVGFEDVVIEPATWPADAGAFRVQPQKSLGLDGTLVASLTGRFVFRDRWVIAGISVPVAAPLAVPPAVPAAG